MVVAQTMMIAGMNEITREEDTAGRSTYHPELTPDVKSAAYAGVDEGRQPGACDYWQKHPEAVAEMRRSAELVQQSLER